MNYIYILNSIISTSNSGTSVNPGDASNDLSWGIVIIRYCALLLIIFVSLILIGIVRKYFKKEATTKKIKIKCEKARNYANSIKDKCSKQELLIATAKLNKLTSLISNATWVATRTAEDKKDVILDGVASNLDALATYIGTYTEETFYTKKDYQEKIHHVIKTLDSIKKSVEAFEKDASK